jgi:anti-sigma factor (TIGR02949 family)
MNCQETQKFIHVYLDGEFADDDRRDFERHLRHCARCRAMARFEERFKTALRSRVAPLTPPEGLERDVVTRLRAEPAPGSALWKWGIRVVPVGLAAGLLILLVWPTTAPTPRLAAQSPDSPLDGLAEAEPESAPAPGPALTPAPAFRPMRAGPIRPAGFGGHSVDLASGTYSSPDTLPRLSGRTFAFPGHRRFKVTALPLGDFPVEGLVLHRLGDVDIYFGTRHGQSVAIFRHKGRPYQITANMPVDELQGVVQTVFYK